MILAVRIFRKHRVAARNSQSDRMLNPRFQHDTTKTESEAKYSSEPLKRRVLVVDEHPLFRHGLATLINAEPDLVVCCEAPSAPLALETMRTCPSDVAVLDLSLPGMNGLELIKAMKAKQPDLPILMLSMHDDWLYAWRALRAGALGYVTKREALTHVLLALRKVLRGEIYVSPRFSERLVFEDIDSPLKTLSNRELEVIELLGRGLGTKEVAAELHLSVKTIETYRMHIKEKLGFRDANEMVRFAVEWIATPKPD
jgi:DNA-binding NarL/FixJ family response regulator